MSERDIYEWSDHGKARKSDPMAVAHRMADYANSTGLSVSAATTDLQITAVRSITATEQTDLEDQLAAYKAHSSLAAMTRAGFGLKSIDDDEEFGWTESECNDLLKAFWLWSDALALKKKWLAELIADYGPIKALDHEDVYSLWLNRKVALKRRADAVAVGIATLLPSAWMDRA